MSTFRVLSRVAVLLVVCVVIGQQATAQVPSVGFGVFGGAAMPNGDFASTTAENGGAAKTGFTAGVNVDVSIIPMISFVGSFSYVSNSVNDEVITNFAGSYTGEIGSWSTMWPMVGVKYSAGLGPVAGIFFSAQGGLLIGNSPDIDVVVFGTPFKQASVTASSFAYGLSGGVMLLDKFIVEVKWLNGEPEYDYSGEKQKQPTSVILVTAGVMF